MTRLAPPLCLALLLGASPAAALELSGVLLYSADAQGNRIGPAWHTSGGPAASPLAFNAWNPPSQRSWPFANDSRGEIDVRLLWGTHVITLGFQPEADSFPSFLVLNLFFDGDKRDPRISFLVPHRRGFTHGRLNPAYATKSLYLEDVENDADVVYDDGVLRARLGAAFFHPTGTFESPQWINGDFYLVDRVGARDYEPDGQWDGVFVFELDVTASPPRRTPAATPHPPAPPRPVFAPPRLVERSLPPTVTTPTAAIEFPTAATTSTSARSPTRGLTPTAPATPTAETAATATSGTVTPSPEP